MKSKITLLSLLFSVILNVNAEITSYVNNTNSSSDVELYQSIGQDSFKKCNERYCPKGTYKCSQLNQEKRNNCQRKTLYNNLSNACKEGKCGSYSKRMLSMLECLKKICPNFDSRCLSSKEHAKSVQKCSLLEYSKDERLWFEIAENCRDYCENKFPLTKDPSANTGCLNGCILTDTMKQCVSGNCTSEVMSLYKLWLNSSYLSWLKKFIGK